LQTANDFSRALPLFIATFSVAVTSILLAGVAAMLDDASHRRQPLPAQTVVALPEGCDASRAGGADSGEIGPCRTRIAGQPDSARMP
jgi:hypothetical protein